MAQYNTVILGVFQLDFGGESIQFSIESEFFYRAHMHEI